MSRSGLWFVAVLLVALLVLPHLVQASLVSLLSKTLIAGLFALSFNLLVGQAGMLSFGHAAYFGAGTFAAVHLMKAVESAGFVFPTPLVPLAGLGAGLIFGVAAGYFATLRSGVYFAMITFAIVELLHSLAPNMAAIFGGEAGFSSMRMPWAGLPFGSDLEVYYLVLIWCVIGATGLYLFSVTPFGRLVLAIRENEQRVEFLGYNPHTTKVIAFAISAAVSGLAGALLGVANENVHYGVFQLSASVVFNTLVGGTGVFLGPVLGAALMTVFEHFLSDVSRMWLLYQGILFVAIMVFLPMGLGGAIAAHQRPIQDGWLGRLPKPYAILLLSLAALSTGLIFCAELLVRILSSDYTEAVRRAGRSVPINLWGESWDPASPVTWLPVVILFGIGGWLLPPAVRETRRVWGNRGA